MLNEHSVFILFGWGIPRVMLIQKAILSGCFDPPPEVRRQSKPNRSMSESGFATQFQQVAL